MREARRNRCHVEGDALNDTGDLLGRRVGALGLRRSPQGALLRAFSCPDGVWVGSGALEGQEPSGAKLATTPGKHGDRILRSDG